MPDLPTGTVTFLFTDIEGSSRLWEERPVEMSDLLARHDEIVCATVTDHGGDVFATGGDSFAVAFAAPDDAVLAAVIAQAQLVKDLGADFLVRMGLHTGTVERRGGDYFGPVLNRGARLCDAGYGGQVLITRDTYEAVTPDLSDVVFVDLGEHRLRDLSAPAHVFQAHATGLPSEFPPIRSLGAFIHNLPTQLTPFVGRRKEIESIGRLLEENRHATLVGSGGSGKTRLAMQVAADSVHRFPDGAWVVDMRNLVDPAEVAPLVASTLRVVVGGDRPVEEQVVDALWSRQLLLVLDNCEHVLEGVAPLVEQLLQRGGEIRVVATTRAPLGIPGEAMLPIRPFAVPESPDLGQLMTYDGVVLFADRARRVRSDFAIDQHAQAVVDICRACDGLPLALELAAARLRAISPEEIVARLEDQLAILRTKQSTGDLRHATMEATIQWSWDLLDSNEQWLLSRLSIFRGTLSLDAAESICSFDPLTPGSVWDLLTSLVDKSLVVAEVGTSETTRYRLLEPIRQFAVHELDGRATDNLRHRCVDHWAATLETPYDGIHLQRPHQHGHALALEPDQANLTAAIEWALDSERYEEAMAIFGSYFGMLLHLQGSACNMAARWIGTALRHSDSISPAVMLAALFLATEVTSQAWRNEDWLQQAELGMDLARTSDERLWFESGAAMAINRMGRHQEADEMFDHVFEEAENPDLRAFALLVKTQFHKPAVSWALTRQALDVLHRDSALVTANPYSALLISLNAARVGKYDLAIEMAQRSLAVARNQTWRVMVGHAAGALAAHHTKQGRFDMAAKIVDDAIPVVRRILGPNLALAHVLSEAADLARLRGEFTAAHGFLSEAVKDSVQYGDRDGEIGFRHDSAMVLRDEGDLVAARDALATATRMVDELNATDYPVHLLLAAQASVELRDGDPGRAAERLCNAFAEHGELHHTTTVHVLELTAIALAQLDRAQEAARLLGRVDREREETGLVVQPPDIPIREDAVRRARSVLGEGWDTEVSRGRVMTLDEAVEFARTTIGAEWGDAPL